VHWITKDNSYSTNMLLDILNDNFVIQNVSKITMVTDNDRPHLLDLTLTMNDLAINITYRV